MKTTMPLLVLALLALALTGCSKQAAVTDLGVIQLVPNIPQHITVRGVDWTITETRLAGGRQTIIAESTERKITKKDISDASAPPNAKVGSTVKETLDLSNLPAGVETLGYFGRTLARYTLKHDAN